MYWTRYQPLKERLKSRAVSDREALPYLLLFSALEAVVLSIPAVSEMNMWNVVETVSGGIVALIGVFHVYRKNGGKAGYDIVHKFVVLGWVVGVRFLLVALPVGGLIYGVANHYGFSGSETTPFDVVFFSIVSLAYYERLGRHIAETHIGYDEQETSEVVE